MWLNKLFNKKEMVVENAQRVQDIKDALSKYSKFQWIKTENQGNVVEFKDVVESGNSIFVEFTDGSRCNYDLLDEFMLKVSGESELLDFSKDVPPDPKKNMSATASIGKKAVAVNPIHALLNKQKPNVVGIEIAMEINIPPQDLYKVICESFENSEDEIINYIVTGLDVDVIRSSVKEAIKKYYNSDAR
jgi:hypothetical protein